MQTADVPFDVSIDDPHADTEWNDILRMQGILPPKPPSPTAFIEEALADARRIAHENRLEQASIDALAKLEDDEDEAFLAHYRDKRLRELATIAATSLHGSVYSIQRPDYARDVTEASHDGWVLVLLTSPQGENTESRLAEEAWLELSHRWCDLKFCQMRADLCIEGYPEKNTPTVLVYRNGDIKKQLITFKELQGEGTTVANIEKLLMDLGAIGQGDPRWHTASEDIKNTQAKSRSIRPGKAPADDQDSDWD